MDAVINPTPPNANPGSLPEVFGFGFSCPPTISNGQGNFVATLINKMSSDVVVKWVNTHIYLVTITGNDGTAQNLNDFLPAPLPNQDPTTVKSNTEYSIVFKVDTSKPPYKGNLNLDPANAPYKIFISMNSSTHFFSASALLSVS